MLFILTLAIKKATWYNIKQKRMSMYRITLHISTCTYGLNTNGSCMNTWATCNIQRSLCLRVIYQLGHNSQHTSLNHNKKHQDTCMNICSICWCHEMCLKLSSPAIQYLPPMYSSMYPSVWWHTQTLTLDSTGSTGSVSCEPTGISHSLSALH